MTKGDSGRKPLIGIVMGSVNDLETMRHAQETLEEFGVPVEIKVLSAHRTPDETLAWAKEAESRGFKVLIAAAGLAAHLAGVVAANSTLPVLGVPIGGGALSGLDALLSTVQMPKGTPVGTVAIGTHGAVNAALLAIRILALSDKALLPRLENYRDRLKQEILSLKV